MSHHVVPYLQQLTLGSRQKESLDAQYESPGHLYRFYQYGSITLYSVVEKSIDAPPQHLSLQPFVPRTALLFLITMHDATTMRQATVLQHRCPYYKM